MKVLYMFGYFVELYSDGNWLVLTHKSYPAFIDDYILTHLKTFELNEVDQILYGYHEVKKSFHNRIP